MPSFVRSIMESNTSAYIYDITGESPNEIAQRLMSVVDSPFDFIGSVNGRQATLPIQYVESTLGRGGMVAAEATMHGVPVVIRFQDANTLVIRPSNSAKNVADAIAGISQYADAYEDSYEDDFADPFAQASATQSYANNGFGETISNTGFDDPRAMANTGYDPYPPREVDAIQDSQVVGKGEWFLMLILLAIPIVNIVALIVWLVSKKTKKSKKNYLIVQILLFLVNFILILGLTFFAIQSGIISTNMFPGASSNVEEVQQNENTNNNDNNNAADNESANENSNSNVNNNANANNNVVNTSGENVTNTANQVSQPNNNTAEIATSSYAITSYSFSCISSTTGKKVGIITLQVANNSNSDLIPSDQLKFEVLQGQNTLAPVGAAMVGYDPANMNNVITPGSTGNLVIAYELVDDQQVHFRTMQKDTNAQLIDVYFSTY